MRAGLRTRFFAVFAGFAGVLAAIAGVLGARLIAREVVREADAALRLDLQAARHAVDGLADEWSLLVEVLGGGRRVAGAYAAPGSAAAIAELEGIRHQVGWDLLLLTDSDGAVVVRSAAPQRTGDRLDDAVVTAALAGATASGYALLPVERLRLESGELTARLGAEGGSGRERLEVVLLVAAPARRGTGEVAGALVAGIAVRGNRVVRDRLRAVIGSEAAATDPTPRTVSVWAGGQAVLSTAPEPAADPGTGAAEDGRTRSDAAGAGLVASTALLGGDGSPVAVLEVRQTEERLASLRRSLLGAYGALGLAAVAVALAVAWSLAGHLAGPMKRLERAARDVSAGDYGVRVEGPRAGDEVGDLTAAFNRMATALAEHEEGLAAARRELEAANARLTELNHSYLSMLGFVSHELKNVLGTISWSAHALDDGLIGTLPQAQGQLVHAIRTSIDAALAMTRNYLDLARIEDDRLEVAVRACELCDDVVVPVVEELRGEAARLGKPLAYESPGQLRVTLDPELAKVIVRNLVGNAIAYGRPGAAIVVRCGGGGGWATCEVWNEGRGLTAEQAAAVFERFRRFADADPAAPRGSGLGLFVSREIARRQGGDVTVESSPGEWVRFVVRFPATGPAADAG